MEVQPSVPFECTESKAGNLKYDIYPTKIYTDAAHNCYVEVRQTCPMTLITNAHIRAEEVTKNVWSMQKGDEIKTCTEIDQIALSLFMNSFLGDIEKEGEKKDLTFYYDVAPNIHNGRQNTETVITCYRESSMGICVPEKDKRYRCFSLESRLLALYSTYHGLSSKRDDRNKVTLRHLDNIKKECVINISNQFEVQSIFLEGYFLIVGSYVNGPNLSGIVKNKYRIDIYDAEQFSNDKNNDTNINVFYYLGIDIEEKESENIENEQAKSKDPLFKLITVEGGFLFLQNQRTKEYILPSFSFRSKYTKKEGNILTTYSLNPILDNKDSKISVVQPVSPQPTSQPPSKNTQQTSIESKKSLLRNSYVQIGIGGSTILLFVLLYYGYHNKKCF
jgi:hypothetical protein